MEKDILLNELDVAFTIDSLEKNQMYHRFLNILNNNSDLKQVSQEIVLEVEQFLLDKKSLIEEKMEQPEATSVPSGGIFRRIG